jgi:chemotaxis protein MotB
MALSSRRSSEHRLDIWPGFVDALTTLLMIITFLLTVFVLAQFFLSEALSGRDQALDRLRGEMAELAELLSLERKSNTDLRGQVTRLSDELQTSLNLRDNLVTQLQGLTLRATTAEDQLARFKGELDVATTDRDRLAKDVEALAALRQELEAQVKTLLGQVSKQDEQLITEKNLSETARAQVALLNQQLRTLREQIAQLSQALDVSEKAAQDQRARITNLGQRLNAALASRVQELTRFRSEFFGRLREILGNQSGIRIVGDRFVFQSEVLFAPGSADLGEEGQKQIAQIAKTLVELSRKIPPDINWILEVDGHTDRNPIATARFPSNWELSTARAITVVRALVREGLPAERLAATGFGEFQPLDPGDDTAAFARNRRIELKLTQH